MPPIRYIARYNCRHHAQLAAAINPACNRRVHGRITARHDTVSRDDLHTRLRQVVFRGSDERAQKHRVLALVARARRLLALRRRRAADRIAHRRHGHSIRAGRRCPASPSPSRRSDTGAVRTDVTDGDGALHRHQPGAGHLRGARSSSPASQPSTQRRRRSASARSQTGRRRRSASPALTEAVTVTADAPVLDTVVGEDRRQRLAGGSREPAGQRPQLRQPDDAGDRRHHRRQRRLGERAVQRQVEPAELPELRRRRRHLCVGREPRLPERHRLAVPPADVDGVGRRVPRQLGPGAGRERPRRRRQHHGRQQERQQPLHAARSSNTSATTRSTRPASTTTRSRSSSSTSSAGRSAARSPRNKTFFFGSYEGLRQTTGLSFTEAVPSDEARRRILAGEPVGTRRRPERRRARGGGAAARRLPARHGSRRRTRCSRSRRSTREAEQKENTRLGPRRSSLQQQPVALRALPLQRRRRRHARPHRDAAPRAAPSSSRRTSSLNHQAIFGGSAGQRVQGRLQPAEDERARRSARPATTRSGVAVGHGHLVVDRRARHDRHRAQRPADSRDQRRRRPPARSSTRARSRSATR